ncbi:MAG: hypothetical protein OXC46_00945 [Thaumarchaeota archaeon]|nr:hypothetical protein [Nitrososphaerota archaeon]
MDQAPCRMHTETGGFNASFKTQIYPFGYETRVKKLYNRMSVRNKTDRKGHRPEFPVTVRNTLPEKPVALFERWIKRVEVTPPCVDTTVRCKHKS